MQLSPLSCRGLRHTMNQDLQFTVQVEGSENTEIIANTVHPKSSDFVDRVQLYQDKCYCVNCGQKVLADHCKFSRVLSLPSENWSDYSDMWFCHKHDDDKDEDDHNQRKISLLPKSHECFVGETYFLIRSNRVKLGHTRMVKDIIQCGRCGSKLGHIHDNKMTENEENMQRKNKDCIYKLYRHSTLFLGDVDVEDKSLLSLSVQSEDFFAHLILEQSHLYTCFRLLLEAEIDNRKIKCLIWLIDPNLIIFHGKESNSTKLHLQPQRVLKILYKCYIEPDNRSSHVDKDTLQEWIKDNSVHSFQLPYPMAVQLITCLIANTKCIPRSQRYLRQFHTGFLKYMTTPS